MGPRQVDDVARFAGLIRWARHAIHATAGRISRSRSAERSEPLPVALCHHGIERVRRPYRLRRRSRRRVSANAEKRAHGMEYSLIVQPDRERVALSTEQGPDDTPDAGRTRDVPDVVNVAPVNRGA